jgi:hypothetical protein
LIDFESRSGSFHNLAALVPHIPTPLKPNSVLNFAFSTRKFEVAIDYSYVSKTII